MGRRWGTVYFGGIESQVSRLLNIYHSLRKDKYALAHLISFVNIGASGVAQFILSPVVKEVAGVEALGLWHIIFQSFVLIQLIDFGITNAIIKEISLATDDDQRLRSVYRSSRFVLVVIGGLFSALCFGVAFYADLIQGVSLTLKGQFQISLVMLGCWGLPRYLFRLEFFDMLAKERVVIYNVIGVLEGPLRPLLAALLLVLTGEVYSLVLGYILIEVFVRLLSCLCNPISWKGRLDKAVLESLLRFCGAVSLIRIANLIVFYCCAWVIAANLGAVEVAIFQSTVALPYFLARFLFRPFMNLLPKIIRLHSTHDKRFKSFIVKNHLYVLGAAFLFSIVIFIVNPYFVDIWVGSDLYAGHTVGGIYCLFIFVAILRHNGYIVCQGIGALRMMLAAHAVELVVFFVFTYCTIATMGLMGVALGLLLAHIAPAAVSQIPFLKGAFSS